VDGAVGAPQGRCTALASRFQRFLCECSHFGDAVVVARRRRAARGKASRGRHSSRRPALITATATACRTPRHPATTQPGSLLVLSRPRHLLSFRHRVVTGRVCSVPRHRACRHWRRAVEGLLVLTHRYGSCCCCCSFSSLHSPIGKSLRDMESRDAVVVASCSARTDSCAPVCTLLIDGCLLDVFYLLSLRRPPSPAVRRLPLDGPRSSAMPGWVQRAIGP